MSPFRYRDDDSSNGPAIAGVLLGALAGFAVGMFVAQRVGGFSGLAKRIKTARAKGGAEGDLPLAVDADAADDDLDESEYDEVDESEDIDEGVVASGDDGVPMLEERVLEAFNNDPILAERAIDIGAVGAGIIELAGWVDDEAEAEHAMTIA